MIWCDLFLYIMGKAIFFLSLMIVLSWYNYDIELAFML